MSQRLFLFCCAIFSGAGLFAQNPVPPPAAPPVFSCGADAAQDALFDRIPERARRQAEIEDLLYRRLSKPKKSTPDSHAPVYTLPVVVHIIHNGGPENITDIQVLAAIDHLNDACAHTGYFAQAGPGVDANIRFCLARRAPDGKATSGITRTQSALTDMVKETDDLAVKDLVRWDPLQYVNIWVVGSITSQSAGPGVAGYAFFPSSHGHPEDGLVCEAGFFGKSPIDDGVLIHEMGHYLGLYHTFEGGCPNADCLLDGDRVCDTPPDQAQHSTCGFNSCSTDADAPAPNPFTTDVGDMTENFMDYSPFDCYYRFTQGQAERMQAAVEMTRHSLLDSKACLSPCSPPLSAAFTVTPAIGLAGDPVSFINQSVGATMFEWSVNGVPFSNAPNPVYTFPSDGSFVLSLLATNSDPNCIDQYYLSYEVECPGNLDFTVNPASATVGEPVELTSLSTGVTSVEWLINGVSVGTAPTLSYAFPNPGLFTVTLVGTNAYCSKSAKKTVPVQPAPCVLPNGMPCSEICGNGVDDDGDGYVDCYDPDCLCFNGADCVAKTPPVNNFSAQQAWETPAGTIMQYAMPVVANLNPQTDSLPEIILHGPSNLNSFTSKYVAIYQGSGSNAAAPDLLQMPFGIPVWPDNGAAVGDLDGDGIPELVLVENTRYINVYRNFTPGANPPMQLWVDADLPLPHQYFRPQIADFDQDGVPEIYAGANIFKLDLSDPANPTLKKALAGAGPYGQLFFNNHLYKNSGLVAADVLSPADCNGDPDCNGLELIAGPVVYSVDLDPTDGDGMEIKVVRDLNMLEPGNNWQDGYTAVADMDLDGTPDIVVSAGRIEAGVKENGVYVWNKNGLLKFLPYPVIGDFHDNYNGAFPCIANVYDDTKDGFTRDFPEIIITSAKALNCFNLHAAALDPVKPWWWTLPTTDDSGMTGATVFDFNSDGLSEIVYRDERFLRILYGGHTPLPAGVDAQRNWWKTTATSGTLDEYPVVADVDGDGQAEIVSSGDSLPGGSTTRLRVFETAGAPWAPCRNIWNQSNYNPVDIADDLSIPQVQQKSWLEFPAPGGGKYPLNIHMAQLPKLDAGFQPYYPVPDASIALDSFSCMQQLLQLQLRVCNAGSIPLPAGTPLQFYLGDPTSAAVAKFGLPASLPAAVPIDSCLQWPLQIPLPPNGTLWGVINDNGSLPTPFDPALDFPSTNLPECVYPNNLFSVQVSFSTPVLDLGPDRTLCSSSVETLHAGAGFARYRWPDGSPDSLFTAPGPGKYWVDAWDICGNKYTDTLNILLQNTTPLDLGPDRPVCAGDSVTLSAPGFANLLWSPASALPCSTCPTVRFQPDSSLTLYATGQSGNCIVSDSVRLTVQPKPAPQWQVEPAICNYATGTITLDAAGGSPPFLYSWPGSQTGNKVDSLTPGIYRITVTNAAGCSAVAVVHLPGTDAPFLVDSMLTPVRCFGGNDGRIAVEIDGGSAPYTYSWSNGPGNETRDSLVAGMYTLTVTSAEGCTLSVDFSMPQPEAVSIEAHIDSTSCTAVTAGIAVAGGGGTAPYAFLWDGGQMGPVLTDLPPGAYTVQLSDANGCTAAQTFLLEPGGAPALTASTLAPARCYAEANGQIEVEFGGGVPPYAYEWSTGPGSATLANVPAGDYALTVTDASGCTGLAAFTVTQPDTLALQVITDPTTCASTLGNIALSATGGTGPYAFSWSDGPQTALRTNLPPGTYQVTLSDAQGCSQTQSFTIEPGGAPTVTVSALTPVRCFGEASGQISVAVDGGVPPYLFGWSTGPGGATLSDLPAGNYALTVTDVKGCTSSLEFVVETPAPLEISQQIRPDTCGQSTGSIALAATGGTAPYAFAWPDGQKGDHATALAAGPWSVTVSDARGCESVKYFTVPGTDILVVFSLPADTITCAKPRATLGSNPAPANWLFQWQTPTGAVLTGANQQVETPGLYAVTVTNEYGCTAVKSVAIADDTQPPIAIAAQAHLLIPCDQVFATLDASASSAGPAYTVRWYLPSGGQLLWDTLARVAETSRAGTYILQVTDTGNGCSAFDSVEVALAARIDSVALLVDSVSCFGYSDGSVLVDQVFGGTGPYGFSLDDHAFGPERGFVDLAPGIHLLQVHDANGCVWEDMVTIGQPDSLAVALQVSAAEIELGQLVTLEAQVLPPNAQLASVEWVPANLFDGSPALYQQVRPVAPTLFEIHIRDQHGCEAGASVSVQVRRENLYLPNVFRPSQSGNDVFMVYAGADVRQVRLLRVYDRWGGLLFERQHFQPNDPAQGWDGTWRGKPVDAGVYVYFVQAELADGGSVERAGDVTVLR